MHDGRPIAQKSAVLVEFSAVLVENSKRRVNFCTPQGRFSVKVSARRAENEAKLVSASYPEPKQHLDFYQSVSKASGERSETCFSFLSRAEATLGFLSKCQQGEQRMKRNLFQLTPSSPYTAHNAHCSCQNSLPHFTNYTLHPIGPRLLC